MRKILFMVSLVLASCNILAAPVEGAPAAECDGVKVATGPKGKGYSNMFADIKKVCGRKVNLCEVNTGGGLDNLNALSTKEADIGFAQLDTLNDMKSGDENIAALQAVQGMNFNFLHVVTATNGYAVQGEKKLGFLKGDAKQVVISRFSELRGQRVALVGSASLLGRRLNQQLGFQMQFIDAKDDNQAFEMVRNGQVAAAFTVSGWQHGVLKNLSPNDGLTLVPFDAPIGEPYKVKPLNYKSMAVYNVNSLGIPNVLLSRPFSGQRAANVAAIQSCIQSNLTELKEGNYQPAWNEVKGGDVPGVVKFSAKK